MKAAQAQSQTLRWQGLWVPSNVICTTPKRKSKLAERTWTGVFLCVSENGLDKILNLETKEVRLEGLVRFDESTFPADEGSMSGILSFPFRSLP